MAPPTEQTGSDGKELGTLPARALLARVQDQLSAFRNRELGRELGYCLGCGKPVRSQQQFIREGGSIMHVSCRTARASM